MWEGGNMVGTLVLGALGAYILYKLLSVGAKVEATFAKLEALEEKNTGG
jgi:hypothetical protein